MATALPDLPRFLVLSPLSTVRVEIRLASPACEIDVELDNPGPGRSFVLLIGHKDGPFVQRVRLAGKARIYFDPQSPGDYVLLVANPQKEPIVLRLRARDVDVLKVRGSSASEGKRSKATRSRGPPSAPRAATKARTGGTRRTRSR
ncbi:MAG TPA: hypothetical protein VJ021_01965 [Thermoplasmata archaeon]|nr:hypothetical protein [Thermoplasmata archaeon]